MYYEQTVAAIFKFRKSVATHKSVAARTQVAKVEVKDLSVAEEIEMNDFVEEAVEVGVLSGRAEKKWNQLDVDSNGYLDSKEAEELAEWVWCSFRPGRAITSEVRQAEAAKLMSRCDVNSDGVIDQ